MDKTGGGESINIYRRKFFVSHCRNFRRGILYCCISFGYRKSLDKKEEGVSLFYFENFLSHSAEKFLRWTLLCCVSKNSRLRKSLWIRRQGGRVSRFIVENFLSHTAEISVGEFFTVALVSGIEKVWIRKRREYRYFLSKIFCLTVPKNFLGEPFSVVFQNIPGSEKFYG